MSPGARATQLLGAMLGCVGALAASRAAGAGPAPDDAPTAVYSPDASDAWNRAFHALFTRMVRHRTAAELLPGVPTEPAGVPGLPGCRVSIEAFDRREVGDRAIEPLVAFPVHIGSRGTPQPVLSGPRFDELAGALRDVLRGGPAPPSPGAGG